MKLAPWNWFKKETEGSGGGELVTVDGGSAVHPFARLQREMDNLFESFLRDFTLSGPDTARDRAGWLRPRVDISESDDGYHLDVEIPGVDKENLELSVADGVLTVSGEQRHETEDKDRHYHRVERSYGSFRRVLSLPDDADEDSVTARFRNGILSVTIRKDPERTRKLKRVEIQ